MNRMKVRRLTPYLLAGLILWIFIYRSGIHATVAGVLLALTIPIDRTPSRSDGDAESPLHRLEHSLHMPVNFLIIPLFALANAGVPVLALSGEAMTAPVTIGVAAGLLLGKPIGVFGFAGFAVQLKLADMPAHATGLQMLGVALLCGIGFTMSLFIALLAFPASPLLQSEAKLGILAGSLLSGMLGYLVLRAGSATPHR
jgi:NhaA family Na+:H+ antiporter